MWIVKLALRQPYTFIVMALAILILGVVAIYRTAVDIFPVVDIPVVSVIWTYSGMAPDEMTGRITTVSERAITTTVSDIEHIESQSYNGVSVIKVYFHTGANIPEAVAEVTAVMQGVLRVLPPGITPPFIIQYSASDVPILQAAVYSDTLSEDRLNDYSNQFIRTQLATVQGASVPLAYGGAPRNLMVDLDPERMFAKNISAADVSDAFNAQSLILPSGDAKMGVRDYNVRINNSPTVVEQLNDLPIKQVNGVVVYLRDVAHVRLGAAPQTNLVRRNGRRSALLTILKSGGASTLDVVNRVKARMPSILATLPPELKLDFLFDQSVFVRASIAGVVREAIIAACLTGLMILLFLGSWRSTLIVVISIPPASNAVPGNLVGGYFRALGNVFDFHAVTFGLAIEIPIRNRTAKANLAGARIQGEQLLAQVRSLEQTIEVDVRNAAQAVEITRKQILAARAARESAEIQLAGEQKRYRTGLSTTFLVLQFQNQLVNARTAEIRAEANYNQAIANLQRATATTLRANNVIVKPPSTP